MTSDTSTPSFADGHIDISARCSRISLIFPVYNNHKAQKSCQYTFFQGTVDSLKICQGKIVLQDLFYCDFPDNLQYNYVSLLTMSEMHMTPMQFPALYTAAVFHLPVQIQKYMKRNKRYSPCRSGFHSSLQSAFPVLRLFLLKQHS